MAMASGRSERGRDAGARARSRADVFPDLGACVGAGLLAGWFLAIVIAGLFGQPVERAASLTMRGAALGGILGLFVGLGRAARPAAPAVRFVDPELWDPWLDHGRDLGGPIEPEIVFEEPASPEEQPAPIPARALVRPRVISPQTGEAIPLEDEVGTMLQEGRGGLIVIVGGSGSGKTAALRHLAAILPPWTHDRVRLLEDLDLTAIASAGPDPLVVLIADRSRIRGIDHGVNQLLATLFPAQGRLESYQLAPWTQDDAIEYLLANDRDACSAVIGRLRSAGDFSFLDGIPELCTAVLDRMARDDSIGDVRTALRHVLSDRIEGTPIRRKQVQDQCLLEFRTDDPKSSEAALELMTIDPTSEPLARLIRHRPAALLLAADGMTNDIERGYETTTLAHRYSHELVLEVAPMIAGNAAAIQHLNTWVNGKPWRIHSLAASLLHATTPGWRPEPGCRPCLEGAFLDGVSWAGQELEGVNLRHADLRGADLRGANLNDALARRARLHGARLRAATLNHANATRADLTRADLSQVQARRAQLCEADLAGALLIRADLWEADLKGTRIDEADFTGANLENARLKGLPLCRARFDDARFGGSDLRECDMEGMVLTGPDFHEAQLNAALLTGSRMPGANFLGADLRGAGLAEIDWPGACLRDADLRGANFHLGTTRSGLVDSPIACEGSRTGFYTDDDLDRHIRPAEEIRKANLSGADLRGANIRDVDFYLVDLRGARYTDDQAEHFRRCRAILDDGAAP